MDSNLQHYPSYNTGMTMLGSNLQSGVGGAATGLTAKQQQLQLQLNHHHREMHQVGRDLGKDPRELRAASSRRQKRGQCLSCGEQLFKIGVFGKKTPLTTAHVLNGRCLTCYPVAMDDTTGDDLRRHEVPRVLHVRQRHPGGTGLANDDDAMTVVSAITIDPKLLTESGEVVEEGSDDGDDPQKTPHKHGLLRPQGQAEPASEVPRASAATAPIMEVSLERPLHLQSLAPHPAASTKPAPQAPPLQHPPPPPADPFSPVRQTSIVWRPPPPLHEASGEDDDHSVDRDEGQRASTPDDGKAQRQIKSKPEVQGSQAELRHDGNSHDSATNRDDGNGDDNGDDNDTNRNDDSAFDDLPSMVDLDLSCSYCSTTNQDTHHESTSLREIHVEPETLPPDDAYDDEVGGFGGSDLAISARFEPQVPPFVGRQSSLPAKKLTAQEAKEQADKARQIDNSNSFSSADGAQEAGRTVPAWVAASGGSLFPCVDVSDSATGSDSAAVVSELLESLRPSQKGSSPQPSSEPQSRIQTLHRLGTVLGTGGADSRRAFCQHGGITTMTGLLWAGSSDPGVLEAVLRLLLALVAGPDVEQGDREEETAKEPLLVGEDGEACVDALLISLQTTVEHAIIQELGCLVLAGLAQRLSNDSGAPSVDGAEMGVQAVLRSMARHSAVQSVQEAGMRALYNQCCWSGNAIVNQRVLLTGRLEDGTPSVVVLTQSLRGATHEPLFLERFSQLLWCLSAAPTAASALFAEPMGILIASTRTFSKERDSLPLLQAALGACANLSVLDGLENALPTAAAALALELLPMYRRCPGLVTEACCVIANATEKVEAVDSLAVADAVTAIVEALARFKDDLDLQDEGMRALLTLSLCSSLVRNALLEGPLYSQVMALGRAQCDSQTFQESFCRILGALCLRTSNIRGSILAEMVGYIGQMASRHLESEVLHELVCLVWRELSGDKAHRRSLVAVRGGANCVVTAMKQHPASESIQHDACCVHGCWRSPSSGAVVDERERLSAIVAALQGHLTSPRLAEAACVALWSITKGSESRKRVLLQIEGAMESVFSALVMYPEHEGILRNTVGLLASWGSSPAMAEHIFTLERVEAVVDTIRGNRGSVSVLERCALFIRNAVSFNPDLADPSNRALSVVLGAMKEPEPAAASHPERTTEFLVQGCKLLWTISAQSMHSKALVLELDGVSVLMSALEQHPTGPVLQPALGAFNELALNAY